MNLILIPFLKLINVSFCFIPKKMNSPKMMCILVSDPKLIGHLVTEIWQDNEKLFDT